MAFGKRRVNFLTCFRKKGGGGYPERRGRVPFEKGGGVPTLEETMCLEMTPTIIFDFFGLTVLVKADSSLFFL